ncbi:hypothetical protein MFFC18_15710 [Mariniblastus fucicola]|uniref:Uncharacterized protein n=1 Tax=Mariniblastus fucicola TaxID=980251 RepID=A0A5B9P9T7_9BACT|nr:hypothetical protein MFFC18_15710 [Mariniblastus fucicola]
MPAGALRAQKGSVKLHFIGKIATWAKSHTVPDSCDAPTRACWPNVSRATAAKIQLRLFLAYCYPKACFKAWSGDFCVFLAGPNDADRFEERRERFEMTQRNKLFKFAKISLEY